MEELVWAKSVKYLEYGSRMSYVVSLASHAFEDKERFVDLLRPFFLGLCFSGLVYGILHNVSPFLLFYNLLPLALDFYVFIYFLECLSLWIWWSYISIKLLLPMQKKKKKKKIKRHEQGYLQILCFWAFNFWIYFDWTIYFILITAIIVKYFYLFIYF